MLKNNLNPTLLIKQPSPITIIFVLFAVIHLLSLFKADSPLENIYILSFFYGITAWFYLQNFPQIKPSAKLVPRLVGIFIIAYLSIKTLSIFHTEFRLFWFITPPLIFLAFSLIINGWTGIKDFWRALVGITALSWVMPLLASLAFRFAFLQKISAQLSSYFLWYLGFQSQSRENFIFVNDGAVNVNGSCTALPIFFIFLSLLVILSLYFPRLIQNLPLTTALALGIGFILSIIRIMIMAVVVNDQPVFDYWHGTTGSNIFTSAGLLLFGGYLLWQMPSSLAIAKSSPVIQDHEKPEIQFSPVLTIILWALVGLIATSLLIRQGAAQKFADFIFPETIPISGWTLVKTEALAPLAEMRVAGEVAEPTHSEETLAPEEILAIRQAQEGADIFISGHRYDYKNIDSGKTLTATFRYIVNVNPGSDLVAYYRRRNLNPEILKTLTDADKNFSNSGNTILSFIDQDSTYYSACLTPEGQTQTQSYNQITAKYNTQQVLAHKLKNFLPWFMGQTLLQDDRCLWMELKLSSPDAGAGGSHQSSQSSKIEPLWRQFSNFWIEHYPKP